MNNHNDDINVHNTKNNNEDTFVTADQHGDLQEPAEQRN